MVSLFIYTFDAHFSVSLLEGLFFLLFFFSAGRSAGAPNDKIFLQVSERRFYVNTVLFVLFNGLFLNAKKNVSVRIR